jgi:NADH-quinone oxidoreductase subunit L
MVRFVHRVVFNKYYVDELYGATFVKGTLASSRHLSWFDRYVVDGAVNLAGAIGRFFSAIQGAIDVWVVDGLVNLVATVTLDSGHALRRMQTGQVQGYIVSAMVGALALVLLGYFIS